MRDVVEFDAVRRDERKKKTVSERARDTRERVRVCVCNKATSGQDFVPTGQRAGAINRDITADIHIINADVGKQMMRTN